MIILYDKSLIPKSRWRYRVIQKCRFDCVHVSSYGEYFILEEGAKQAMGGHKMQT